MSARSIVPPLPAMQVLLFTPRLPAAMWSIGPVVAAMARGLSDREICVHLAADSIEDRAMFEGHCQSAREFREFSQTSTDYPTGFARWAARAREEVRHDVSLSMSHNARADAAWPLSKTRAAWLTHNVRRKSALRLAAHLVKHWQVVVPSGMARGAGGLAIGLSLPRFSLMASAAPGEREAGRALLNRSLGLRGDGPVLVLSAPEEIGPEIGVLLEAFRRSTDRAHAPTLLALARDAFSVRAAATRAGVSESVRVLGFTDEARGVLLAADFAVAPFRPPVRDATATGAMGRFVCDALRVGTPALVASGAPGSELVETCGAGVVVQGNSAEGWAGALRRSSDEAFRKSARTAAAGVSSTLGPERWIAALADALEQARNTRR